MKLSICSSLFYTSQYGILISHKPSLLFLSPCNISLLSFFIVSFFLFKSTSQSSLNNCTRDTNYAFRDRRIAAEVDFLVNDGSKGR